jgi:Delta7-sterol 5-desaturase
VRKFTSPWVAVIGTLIALPLIFLHPETRTSLTELVAGISFGFAEYLAYGIGFLFVFVVILARFFPARKLAKQHGIQWRQIRHEIIFSLSSNVVMIAAGIYVAVSEFDSNMMYTQIDGLGGWAYIAFTIFFLLFLHDFAFYWTHRMMHHKAFYKLFHRVHHDSVEPTPFTTFSFHPLESVVQNLNSTLPTVALLFMPWHPISVVIFGLGVTFFNVFAHLGFELYPKNWHRWPILGWKTTCFHHYQHHQQFNGNYGLYFRFWDKLCGTEFKNYNEKQDAIFGSDVPRKVATVEA